MSEATGVSDAEVQAARPSVLAVPRRPVGLGATGWVRWAWRSLTSMRAALILLGLLALAAVPGSLLPQRGVSSDPNAVVGFLREYPTVGPWLDRLGLFGVYSSPWFAAVYLLLLVSMTGCVLPRCARLWRACRAAPPRAPSDLSRLPGHVTGQSDLGVADVLQATARELRRRRFRVVVHDGTVRAEKGYLRELGNLAFHLSLLVLLFGVAGGALFGFEGRVLVTEGAGFANTRSQYDEFSGGAFVDESRLTPFSFTLEEFSASYEQVGPQRGSPRDFRADVSVTRGLSGPTERTSIEVNAPLEVDGTKVFLTGNGFAPRVTVRDGSGREVFTGPVVFLPLSGFMESEGVVKAPDAQPEQLGFQGLFLPTAAMDPTTGPYSAAPDVLDPQLLVNAWTGDLGLSDGAPQSVYRLDTSAMQQVVVDGQPFTQALRPGDTMTLPDGRGSITFDGVSRFANFQLARDPGKEISLAAAVMLLAGVTGSLLIRRRRVWVRAWVLEGGGTQVAVGALSLTRQAPPPEDLDACLRVSAVARTGIATTSASTTAASTAASTAANAPMKENV